MLRDARLHMDELFGEFDEEQGVVLRVEDHHVGSPGLDIGFLDDTHAFCFEILVQCWHVGDIEGDGL